MADEHNRQQNEVLHRRIEGLKTDFNNLKQSVEDKKESLKQKKDQMDVTRDAINIKIDQYYDLLISKINEKREKVKEDYKAIEQKEK